MRGRVAYSDGLRPVVAERVRSVLRPAPEPTPVSRAAWSPPDPGVPHKVAIDLACVCASDRGRICLQLLLFHIIVGFAAF